jgi:hypothetical protein
MLSPAFDERFYRTPKPPVLGEEAAHAVRHFFCLLDIFSQRFIIFLDGAPVAHSYVVERMLAEFAAAAVLFSKAIEKAQDKGQGDEDDDDRITSSMFTVRIERILERCYPDIFSYYSQCFDRGHKHFLWTGPEVQILLRTDALHSTIPLTTTGELLDLPSHRIYINPVDTTPLPLVGKRHDRGESSDMAEKSKKRKK